MSGTNKRSRALDIDSHMKTRNEEYRRKLVDYRREKLPSSSRAYYSERAEHMARVITQNHSVGSNSLVLVEIDIFDELVDLLKK